MGKISVPQPVLYLSDTTAPSLGLRPEQIVRPEYGDQYVFIHDKKEILDLRAIQEEFKKKRRPETMDKPIISASPDGQTPTLLLADDQTEPEEVQDILGEQWEKNEKRLKTQSKVMDTSWIRYVNGYPQASEFDHLFRDALHDRVEKHKQSPLTDPARDPWAYAKEHEMIDPVFASAEIPSGE